VIDLPPLPSSGLASGWSRGDSEGVSLVTLDGRVLATIEDVGIFEAGRMPPGLLILTRGDKRFWVLDVSAHELRQVSLYRAYQLVQDRVSDSLPRDDFAWSVRAPRGTQVLGQYWQQVSECQKPIAMLRDTADPEASPVTGDPLRAAQPSYALGWTHASEAVVAVARGPCDAGSGQFREGVYAFNGTGHVRQIAIPRGSYVFQMWA
jgi:hypothetical protein